MVGALLDDDVERPEGYRVALIEQQRDLARQDDHAIHTMSPLSSTPMLAASIHRRGPWRSFEAVELATLEWVDWFNNRRLLEPIGNIPPAEAEERHYAMLEQSDMAA